MRSCQRAWGRVSRAARYLLNTVFKFFNPLLSGPVCLKAMGLSVSRHFVPTPGGHDDV